DLALYLGGPIEEVHAMAGTSPIKRPDTFTIEESTIVTVRFKSGAIGTLMSSVACNVGGNVGLTVYGTEFKADFTKWEHNLELQLPDKEKAQIAGEEKIFAIEDRAFVDSVRTKKPNPILA